MMVDFVVNVFGIIVIVLCCCVWMMLVELVLLMIIGCVEYVFDIVCLLMVDFFGVCVVDGVLVSVVVVVVVFVDEGCLVSG